jgi:DNA-binding HxlR family transcriptional regulator
MDLHQRREVTVANLARRVSTSRTLLRATLGSLVELELVAPGPGRRGSTRYTLTPAGERVALAAARTLFTVSRLGIRDLALRKWSLPILLALQSGEARFNDLKRALQGITPPALAAGLKALAQADLIRRSVVDGRPPGTSYRLTSKGRRLLPLAERLA